jgi:hypothetical protein
MSSSSPNSSSTNGPTTPSSNNNNNNPQQSPQQSTEGGQQDLTSSSYSNIIDQPTPTTREGTMDLLSKLQTTRDTLLEEKKRNDSYMKRYTEKVAKCERMATLHNLIPRQLFVREDAYQRELEKVAQWSGISDQEIADIYQRKVGDIHKKFRHHGAASSNVGVTKEERRKDPYAGFREIPDFSKVNRKSPNSNSNINNVILRNLDMMRRISSLHSS